AKQPMCKPSKELPNKGCHLVRRYAPLWPSCSGPGSFLMLPGPPERRTMRKLLVIAFTLVLPMLIFAATQDTTKQDSGMQGGQTPSAATSTKSTSLTGKVSDDGKTLTDDAGKSWTVSNPEALKGHEGHEVTVKAEADAAKSEIRVTSVKMKKG